MITVLFLYRPVAWCFLRGMKYLSILMVGVVLATSVVADDLNKPRKWQSTSGHILDASIVSYNSKAGVVRLRSSNGEEFEIPSNLLINSDQELLKQWEREKFEAANPFEIVNKTASNKSPPTIGRHGYALRRGGQISVGDIIREEMKMVVNNGDIEYTFDNGLKANGTIKMTMTSLFETEIVDSDKNGETKVRVHILRDISEMTINVAGEETTEIERGPLDGKKLVGKKESGLWMFSLQNDQPTEEQSKALEAHARTYEVADLAYPNNKVSIGETWDLPETFIIRILGPEMTRTSGSGASTLKEVVDYKGKKHALIIGTMKMKGTDEVGLTTEISAQGHYYRDLEKFVDVNADLKGTMKVWGEFMEDGVSGQMSITGPLIINLTQKIF